MPWKLYPRDQMNHLLFFDLVVCLFLAFQIFYYPSPYHPLLKIASYLLLLISFYTMLWQRDWRLVLGGIGFLGVLAAYSIGPNPFFLNYAFVPADLFGRTRKKWVTVSGIVFILLTHMIVFQFNEGNPFGFIDSFHLPVLILQMIYPVLIFSRRQAKQLKRELTDVTEENRRLIQEQERQRIARDLHDTLGQTMTIIKMKSELSTRYIDKNPEKAKAELADVIQASRSGLTQLRELVASMTYVSLPKEFDSGQELLHTAGIQLYLKHPFPITPKLHPVTETMLALSLRESLTNVIKHSQATSCRVTIVDHSEAISMTIMDNGRGQTEASMTSGTGLLSIRERMTLISGTVHYETKPTGFMLRVTVPKME
ncbi:sensor histidine kinase [Aureibacillus halotolerans]|uniref:histidine kinase n=1 Tax=Aureibacillus halotolerans TaxID=1508390 RepID=A0A4R6TZD5_9BACI|nr:sensor histidine kinase [Aureibacillus halotolerans]TDQ37713.1 two-component system sensor histidine kinase DesK [Aureibacillus halotolerans]